jgi:putative transposase
VVVPKGGVQPAALSEAERDELWEIMHSERFVDLAPAEIYATLLDEGRYVGSIRTMYRELHRRYEKVPDRRRQATHPARTRPELCASDPNELWSWDVTKLPGPDQGIWYFLYWVMDVFSRYAVGWCVTEHETADAGRQLIADTITAQEVNPAGLTIHADRGAQQTAKTVVQLYASLGVTRSHSRPRVSNDNPYSEAGFKTLKYRPDFPIRFDSLQAAIDHAERFFDWYNFSHHHWGLRLLTPAQVHHGHTTTVVAYRQSVLDNAFATHPERFRNRRPIVKPPASKIWINKPEQEQEDTTQ